MRFLAFFRGGTSDIRLSGTTADVKSNDTITVYINGNEEADSKIIISNTVPPADTGWFVDISLNAFLNTVEIEIADEFGRKSSDTFYVYFYPQSTVEITNLQSGHDTGIRPVYLTIKSDSSHTNDTLEIYLYSHTAGGDSIIQSDTILTANNLTWQGTTNLTGYGDTVLIILTNRFGDTVYNTVVINYYPEPIIAIHYPENNIDTKIKIINLSGTTLYTNENDTVQIYLHNPASTPHDTIILSTFNGEWSGTVELSGLGDTVIVKLTDAFFRTVSDSIIINYFDSPLITATNITGGLISDAPYDTNLRNISLNGTVINVRSGDTVSINISGTEYTDSTVIITDWGISEWSIDDVVLNDFLNTVVLTINDSWGRKTSDTKYIYYYPTSEIEILNPLFQHDTSSQEIYISGRTDISHIGDMVEIYLQSAALGGNPVFHSDTVLVSNNGTWQGTVSLTGHGDTVIVVLVNRFGDTVSDMTVINYLADLEIKITHPVADERDTKVQIINISGTTLNTKSGDTVYMYVNNNIEPDSYYIITEYNGDWSGTVCLTDIGDSVWVKIEQDFSGASLRSQLDTVTVNYFESPVVEIVSPSSATTYENPYETMFNEIVLSGTTGNTKYGDTISVYVNGGIVSVADTTIYSIEGNWTIPVVSLNDYLNTVVVQITDNWDRYHSDTIYIYSYPQPEIEIYSPLSGSNLLNPYDTNVQLVILSGTVRNIRNNDTILIRINDVSLSDSIIEVSELGLESDTTFSIEIKLNDFLNTVVANVYDGYGRQSDTTEYIYYYPQSSVEITNPLNNHDTGSQEIYITVKTDTSHIDDTVYIYLLSESVYVLQSTSHLTGNNQIISGTTELNGINDMVLVVLENKFEDTVFTDVVINYYHLPNTLILSPYNNHDTNVSYIAVSGTVDSILGNGNDTVTVYVNSIPADTLTAVTSDTGFWSIDNVLLTGRNDTIYFSVVDSFGRTIISDYITVNYYTEPELKLTSPVSQTSLLLPYEVDTNIIILSGTANQTRPGDTVYVYINDILQNETAVISEINGNWTLPPVAINDNFNTVVIEIHDNWSRQNYDTFYVYYYLPPVIEILSPENFSDTTVDEIIVSGTVSNTRIGDTVYIIHNNDTIAVIILSDNTWETSVRFTAYANRLTAIINDGFGRYNTDIINCTYQLRVPNLDDDIDTPFSIIQNAEDTIVITASDVTQSGTWVITADFGTLNNKISINRPKPEVITGSVSNYVRNEDTAAGMFIEIKTYDETDNLITDFTNHKISLSLNYSGLNLNPENVKIFWLNENDSIWYDVMVPWQPGGAIAENFQNDTNNKVVSVDLKHFSHYYVGEGWTDTVTVVIKEDILSDTIYPDSFVTVTSVYILGDTVTAAGDTLTEFTIRNIGNIDGTKIDEMKLWRDINNNGIYDDGDIFITDLIWYADSGVWYNSGFDTYLSLSGDTFVVTALFNDVMKRGDTFQAVIPAGGVNTEREYPGPVADRINNGILLADLLCEIFISSPETDIDTIVQIITLSGTKINADASDTIEILINGEHHYYYEIGDVLDDWSCTVELNVGSNLITVILTSSDSTASAFITLNYLPLGYETDLNNAVIVPNPFRPNDGNIFTGLNFSGSRNDIYNQTGIHILRLTDNVKIEIYDILGRRVRTLSNIEGYGMAIWDGKKSNGIDVSSGTYLFVISNDFQRKVLKAAIIR